LIIDEDFLSPDAVSLFQKRILENGEDVFWLFVNRTSPLTDTYANEDNLTLETFQMISPVIPGSPIYYEVMNIFHKFLDKHKIKYKEIHRIKFNLVPQNARYPDDKYHTPHVDTDKPHKVFLYYINDSDGDTFMFNEVYAGSHTDSFTVNKRISPKAGKAIMFDGLTYHASSSPKQSPYRCILNIDFIVEE
jgi:hypothetical protein